MDAVCSIVNYCASPVRGAHHNYILTWPAGWLYFLYMDLTILSMGDTFCFSLSSPPPPPSILETATGRSLQATERRKCKLRCLEVRQHVRKVVNNFEHPSETSLIAKAASTYYIQLAGHFTSIILFYHFVIVISASVCLQSIKTLKTKLSFCYCSA